MALEDVLTAHVVRPVVAGWLDFETDPVRGWTGPGIFAPTGTGDTDLDGETFLAVGGAVEMTEIVEDRGIGGPITVSFAAGDMEDEEVFAQIVADRRAFMARRAKFWRFFLSEDEATVLPDFTVLFDGVMVSANTTRQTGQPAIISVTCDQDTQKAVGAPTRLIDHQVFYPTDTFSEFIIDLDRGGVAVAPYNWSFRPINPDQPPGLPPRTPPGQPRDFPNR